MVTDAEVAWLVAHLSDDAFAQLSAPGLLTVADLASHASTAAVRAASTDAAPATPRRFDSATLATRIRALSNREQGKLLGRFYVCMSRDPRA